MGGDKIASCLQRCCKLCESFCCVCERMNNLSAYAQNLLLADRLVYQKSLDGHMDSLKLVCNTQRLQAIREAPSNIHLVGVNTCYARNSRAYFDPANYSFSVYLRLLYFRVSWLFLYLVLVPSTLLQIKSKFYSKLLPV